MRYSVCLTLIFLGFLPLALQAAVTINEIAWMGDSASANHEWIELHNNGGAVNLDSWTLSDGDNLNINLSGTIGSNSYAVLERTSDESAPGTAFLIYVGALKNSGATLTLRRSDGGLEDQVSGGEDWSSLGGDNTTKETAQYTTNGWITANPTPGYENEAKSQPQVSDETSSNSNSLTSSPHLAEPVEREVLELELPKVTLKLDISSPAQVFVNQPVNFDVAASEVGPTIINSLQYSWNFGDTNISNSKETEHIYTYPGTYIVHISAEYARQKAVATKEITVLPVAISLTKNKKGDVQINNNSAYSINLSDYRLRANDILDIPINTWLSSRQTITIPRQKIKAENNQMIALYDSIGQLVASLVPQSLQSVAINAYADTNLETVTTNPVRQEVPNTAFQFATDKQSVTDDEDAVLVDEINTSKPVTVAQNDETTAANNWTVIALIALLSIGCVVVLMKPKSKKDSLDIHEQ